ncbi:MAG: PEGA domain-containing protein [Myxococcota bacterium]
MAWLAPLGVALGLLLGPAQPSSISAVSTLPLALPKKVSRPDRKALRSRFEDGITRAGFEHRPAPASARDCKEADCYRRAAESAGIEVFVGGTIERKGPDHAIELYAIAGDTGEVIASVDGLCEICGIGELGDMVGSLAARLRPALDNSMLPTVLLVESDPSGAEVWVDGAQLGTTPLEANISPGTHELEVIKRGHRTEHVELDARSGVKASFSFRLARTTALPQWVHWTALGVGAGSLGGGIALLVIDERPIERDCNPDAEGRCEFLHDTLEGGVALTMVGIALVGTGVGLLIDQAKKDRLQRSGGQARLQLVPGLRGASLVGRF